MAEVQAASRDFDERMAAVEATLDEVVSGIVPPAVIEESPVDGVDGAAAPVAADLVEVPTALTEPTQLVPSLAAVIHPTRDVQPVDDSRWWRRGRDSGAA